MSDDPLAADVRGEGEPALLLLHGFTGSGAAWGDYLLSSLSPHRKVLAVDLPGHGREGTAPVSGFPEALDRLEATLTAHSVTRADWVGYSMGGRIALAAAVERPNRVRRLVLESASPGLRAPDEQRARRARDEELATWIEAEGMEAFVEYWTSQPLFRTWDRLTPRQVEEERSRRMKQTPQGMAAALRGLGTGVQPSYWDRLPELENPTLLLTGALDTKFMRIGEEMAASIRESVHRSVPEAGHAVHLEAPEGWLEEVLGFLGHGSER